MQVEVNSVWQVSSLDGKDDGLYRVLAIYADKDLLILFHITEDKKLERPISAYLSLFIDLAKKKSITVSEYELPAYLNCKEKLRIFIDEFRERDNIRAGFQPFCW